MKKVLLVLIVLIINSANSQNKNDNINSIQSRFYKEYKAPIFIDSGRIDKIKAAFPVVERIYKDYALNRHYPGLVFGVVVDGKLLYSGSTGYTNISKNTPVNTKSMFRIASMTKSFTAMAIIKLRDEGKLNFDDPASMYIPVIKTIPNLTSDAPEITIRHLLTHSAGFPEDDPWGDRQLSDTDEDLIKLIKKGISFSNVPGVSYEYSNLGFTLLGKIITKVSGKSFQNYITENILKPLGMNSTVWEYSEVPENQLAFGYRWQNGEWIEEPLLHDGVYGAMGGLITSIEDFSKYMALHLSAYPPRSDEDNGPIKRSSLREMHHPWTSVDVDPKFKYPNGRACPTVSSYSYGLGWTKDCEERVTIGHGGGLPGFGSSWRILPEYGIGVAAFANLTYAGPGGANWAVLDTIISIAGLKPRRLPASSILDQRKNEIVQLLPDWNNAEKSGIFAGNFFKDNSLDSLKKRCKELFEKAGRIKVINQLIPENQLRGKFMIEGENLNINVFFTLTPENPPLIQQLSFRRVAKK